MKKIVIAAASLLLVSSAHAANQELVLEQLEANPTVPVKYEPSKTKAQKVESRSVAGWYFE